jgi:nucleotide-binding universal stress UspA family protein
MTSPAAAPITRLLVPTDFSEPSEHAAAYAARLAGALRIPLVLAHVHAPPQVFAPDGMVLAAAYDETRVEAALREALEAAATRVRAAGAPEVTTELVVGGAAAELVRLARERGCDLVVMATHGRGGVPRLLLGSVADKVVRRAGCPVLTLGPKT